MGNMKRKEKVWDVRLRESDDITKQVMTYEKKRNSVIFYSCVLHHRRGSQISPNYSFSIDPFIKMADTAQITDAKLCLLLIHVCSCLLSLLTIVIDVLSVSFV